MTFLELLNEEELLIEKSISAMNKARKRQQQREREAGDMTVELSSEAKRKQRKHKHLDWQEDGRNKFKAGRERTVAAVRNKLNGSVSTSKIRDYIYKMYNLWEHGQKEADWILKLEKKARELGFDPRKYHGNTKGESKGLGGKGQPEYNGRAYFFVGLINGFANHFTETKEKRYKPIKDKLKKHKKAVKARKAAERANK